MLDKRFIPSLLLMIVILMILCIILALTAQTHHKISEIHEVLTTAESIEYVY